MYACVLWVCVLNRKLCLLSCYDFVNDVYVLEFELRMGHFTSPRKQTATVKTDSLLIFVVFRVWILSLSLDTILIVMN